MVDVHTKRQRSYNMSKIKGKDTKTEIKLREALWSKGIRDYRTHPRKIFGKPDIIFRKYKIVLFVDGCQWHKCSKHYVEPKTNKSFWINKINRNVERDKKVNKLLRQEGWYVIRVWEHDLKKKNINRITNRILNIMKKRADYGKIKDS